MYCIYNIVLNYCSNIIKDISNISINMPSLIILNLAYNNIASI